MVYLFADEAGNLDFTPTGTKYFILIAVTMRDWDVGKELIELRYRLACEGAEIFDTGFHATEEKQAVRDRVYPLIQSAQLDIDSVVLEKRKTLPRISSNEGYFYQLAWYLLFKHLAPIRCTPNDDLLVIGSTLGIQARKTRFKNAIASVVQQHSICKSHATAFWTASSHPCLQVADYCAWAIQRWKEHGDARSYVLIQPQVRTCFEPFAGSAAVYY